MNVFARATMIAVLVGAALQPAAADPTGAITLTLDGPAQAVAGVPARFDATLTAGGAVPLPYQQVQFLVDGQAVGGPIMTNPFGVASRPVALYESGTRTVQAVAYPDSVLATASTELIVDVEGRADLSLRTSPIPETLAAGEGYLIEIWIENGGPGYARDVEVSFSLSGPGSILMADGDYACANDGASGSCSWPTVMGLEFMYLVVRADSPGTLGLAATVTSVDPDPAPQNNTLTASIGVTADVPQVVLNEVDYDQPGTDRAEFVEIAGEPGTQLFGVSLVRINGATGVEYEREDLSGYTIGSNGLFVVAGADVVVGAGSNWTVGWVENGVQNGAPDAVVLFYTGTNVVIDALSYEGAIHAAQIDGVPGTFDLVAGAPATAADSNEVAASLVRLPDGDDTGDDATDWTLGTPTPGSSNV